MEKDVVLKCLTVLFHDVRFLSYEGVKTFQLKVTYFVCCFDFELVDQCDDHGRTKVVVPLIGKGTIVLFFVVGDSLCVSLYET